MRRGLKRGVAALGITVFACVGADSAYAGIAEADPAFGDSGTVTLPFADETTPPVVESTPGGDIILAGSLRPAGQDSDTQVVRLNPDGTPDEAFSVDGVLSIDLGEGQDDAAKAIAVREDGAVVVLAAANDRFVVEQILADGSPDDEFAGGEAIEFGFGELGLGRPSDIALDANGRAVVVGSAELPATDMDAVVARLTTGGVLDSSFDGDGKVEISSCDPEQTASFVCSDSAAAVHVAPDGDIQLSGSTGLIPRSRSFYAELSPSGALEQTDDGAVAFHDVSSFSDGSALMVGGSADARVEGVPTGYAVHRALTDANKTWEYVPPPAGEARSAAELTDVAVLTGDQAIASGWIEQPQGAERRHAFFLVRPDTPLGFADTAITDVEFADVAAAPNGGFVAVGEDAGAWTVQAFLEPPPAVPQTRIVAGPRGKVHHRSVAFRFRTTLDGAEFECKLDGRRWRACRSPERVRSLRSGRHRFLVRAIAGGKADRTPAKRRFRIR